MSLQDLVNSLTNFAYVKIWSNAETILTSLRISKWIVARRNGISNVAHESVSLATVLRSARMLLFINDWDANSLPVATIVIAIRIVNLGASIAVVGQTLYRRSRKMGIPVATFRYVFGYCPFIPFLI